MTITLQNIRLRAHHGCMPQEVVVGGDFLVTVRVEVPPSQLAITDDDLGGTIDYAAVFRVVQEEMRTPSRLLEHVCGRIARRMLADFPTSTQVSVSLTKCAPPIEGLACDGATVELTLQRGLG